MITTGSFWYPSDICRWYIYIHTHYALYIEVGWRRGRFGQGKGQGQLKLKKKCRYKVINCQACRNPNLLEAKIFSLSLLSLHNSLSRWKRRVLARPAAMRHRDWYSSFSSSVTALVVSCTHPALYSLLLLLASASAWFRFSFVLHNCSFYVAGYTTASSGWCWRLRKGAEAAAGRWRRFVGEWVGGNRLMRKKRRRRRLERSLSTHGAPNVSSSSSPYTSW